MFVAWTTEEEKNFKVDLWRGPGGLAIESRQALLNEDATKRTKITQSQKIKTIVQKSKANDLEANTTES